MNKAKSPYLEGNFAPWRSEDNFDQLTVLGSIPKDLDGVLLRNGPNPQFDPLGTYHWFEGDGMLHAIRFKDGRASYDNRWIRTERFQLENKAQQSLFNTDLSGDDFETSVKNASSNTANTNIIAYQNKLLALNEGASPVAIQLADISTVGDYTFGGKITRRLTAHPRFDHQNNEAMFYSYIDADERLIYYRLNHKQEVITEAAINWPYPAMVHDFVTTKNYVIFPIFPCTMSIARMMRGENIFLWEGDKFNTFFIITDKQGKEVAKIETEPTIYVKVHNKYIILLRMYHLSRCLYHALKKREMAIY